MSHNLCFNEKTQQHSFFTVQQKPWHGLGQLVQDYPTSAEAIRFAGLDYEVVKEDLFTTRFNADAQPMDNQRRIQTHYATMRPDTGEVLGIVGRDYEIIQNRDAFSFFDAIVGGDGIQYETAGALGKGERIFITAKLPSYIKVDRDDLIEQYLFLTTSHDGYGSITAAFTPIRIVCQNTLNAALRNHSNSIKIRHTANAKERLEQAHKVLGIANQLSHTLETLFSHWTKVRISDPQLKKLIELAMVPQKETWQKREGGQEHPLSTCFQHICQHVYEYAQTSPSQQTDSTRGTLFGLYNAVTGYFQNLRNYKSPEAKLKSLLFGGTAQQRGQKAFELCNSFVKGELDSLLN